MKDLAEAAEARDDPEIDEIEETVKVTCGAAAEEDQRLLIGILAMGISIADWC